MKKQQILNVTKIILLGAMLAVGVRTIFATDWSAPLSTPPTCVSGNPGCDAPLNVSYVPQIKQGNLDIKGLVSAGTSAVNGLIVENGNVGIGTINPSAKLDVEGTLKVADGTQGAGKVLMSDANGNASWGTAGTGSTGTGLGIGQSWTNVMSSRAMCANGTFTGCAGYTNTTGKPIEISVAVNDRDNGSLIELSVDGTVLYGTQTFTHGYPSAITAVIPNNSTYKVTNMQTPGQLYSWSELR